MGDRALTTAGPTHVYSSVIRYDRVVQRSLQYIDSSLALRKLPTEVVQIVGNTPTDCYPWEQLYCAANGFVWQPHATIETGAGNSLWLNRKSAENFAGPNAVGYVVLHPANSTGDLRTLDGRYMLNDEPPIVEALVSGYQPVHEGNYGLLLQRREAGKRVVIAGEQTLRVRPNEWLQLSPEQCDTVWRIAVPRTTNFVGRIRSLLYKPDVCIIDLLMPDSTMQTFRYSPATSAGGLWVSPLPTTMGQLANMLRGEEGAQRPVAVRFGFTHARCHATEFDVRLQAVVVR